MLAEVDPSWLRTRGPGRSALRAPDVVGHSPTLIGQVDLAFTVAVSLCDPYAAESLAHTVRVVYIVNRTYGQSPAMGVPMARFGMPSLVTLLATVAPSPLTTACLLLLSASQDDPVWLIGSGHLSTHRPMSASLGRLTAGLAERNRR